jgi:hypothetical protein
VMHLNFSPGASTCTPSKILFHDSSSFDTTCAIIYKPDILRTHSPLQSSSPALAIESDRKKLSCFLSSTLCSKYNLNRIMCENLCFCCQLPSTLWPLFHIVLTSNKAEHQEWHRRATKYCWCQWMILLGPVSKLRSLQSMIIELLLFHTNLEGRILQKSHAVLHHVLSTASFPKICSWPHQRIRSIMGAGLHFLMLA